ncbi:MAG TPA: hypothetical protein P5572_00470 [Phycisphaerae bacterium]|nr:hypothetical protein [Phycisphaerales bacterium]HRX83472.1 hypothetical protein [Phycisphaerae bacterium]
MTFRGRIKNGQITLDEPARLPEGASVVVEVVSAPEQGPNDDLADLLLRHAGKGVELPADLAAQHDRYAHGKPNP